MINFMSSFFLTYTPYHVIVVCGIASRIDNSVEKKLIIIEDFQNAELFRQAIINWHKNPFSEIILLKSTYYSFNKGDSVRTECIIKKINAIKKMLEKKGALTTYIFNDWNPEAQILAKINKNNFGRNIYVEDGFAAYGNNLMKKISFLNLLRYKWNFGSFFDSIQVLGSSGSIDGIMVFYPEFIRNELKNKKIIALPQSLLKDFDSDLIDNILSTFKIPVSQFDAIILINNSETYSLNQKNEMQQFYNKLICSLDSSNKILIKYHPREKNENFLEFSETEKIKICPCAVPIELMLLKMKKNPPKYLFCEGFTTALLTANLIFSNEIKKVCFHYLLNNDKHDPSIDNLAKQFEILLPRTISDMDCLIFS